MEKRLINAVKKQLGGDKEENKSMIQNVANHGADAGWPGFTYYRDTVSFYDKHKKDIVAIAEEMAEELGENVLDMIKSFNCLHNEYTTSEIAKVLYGRKNDSDEYTQIANAMAWFALEEVARYCEDN